MHLRHLRVADAQAAAAGGVDQLPSLCPGGFLKVEPPVRLLTGCVASRDSVILSISAAMAAGSSRSPRNVRLREDVIVRRAATPVGEAHIGIAEHMDAAGAIDGAGFDYFSEKITRLRPEK